MICRTAGSTARAEECVDTETHPLQRIRRPVGGYDDGRDELALNVLEDGAEQVALRPEMVVQRTLRNAGALYDVVEGRGGVALSREQLPGHGQQLPPRRLGSFTLAS